MGWSSFQTWCGVPTVAAKVLYGPWQPLPVLAHGLQTERVRGILVVFSRSVKSPFEVRKTDFRDLRVL